MHPRGGGHRSTRYPPPLIEDEWAGDTRRLTCAADSAGARLGPPRGFDARALHTLAGRGQRVDDRDRIVVDERQQSARGSLWAAPLLFPTLQRANRHAERVREVSLGQLRLCAYCSDVEVREFMDRQAVRLALGVCDRLAEARGEAIEVLLTHVVLLPSAPTGGL